MFILLVTSMLTLAFNIQPVKASGTIYIRADGSIDPPTAPISTVDNITYTFAGDINNAIVIERDNIVVDGAGYTLQGTDDYESRGTDVTGRSNITIKNTSIKNYWYGIFLDYSSSNSIFGNNITTNRNDGIRLNSSSSYNSISGNNITNNDDGVYLYHSSSNSIFGNNITANNRYGIYLFSSSGNNISGNTFVNNGLFVSGSYQNSVQNNTVNGRPLFYLEGVSNCTVDDAGQVILVRCDNIRVEGLNLSRTDFGVELWETSNSTVSGNDITNNLYGIWLDSSSSFNSISANNVTDNGDGISLVYSYSNSISGNNITANGNDGILLYSSSSNSIFGNNITANMQGGIEFYFSSDYNSIFHNNFINNAQQVFSLDSVSVWDNGYPSGGNYWSDYAGTDGFRGPFQNETGSDGIGDTQYSIDSHNTDRYPLMNLWVGTRLLGDINGDRIVDIYDAILLANAYNSVPGKANWNPNADINGDNIVDIYDAILLANHYGQHYP